MASVKSFTSDLAHTLLGVCKIMTLSRMRRSKLPCPEGDTLIILGNGPSLNDAISKDFDKLQRYPSMAVNFAANSDEYLRLRPRYYILVDPHFFISGSNDDNVKKLFKRIAELTDWPMTLFIPSEYAKGFQLPSANDSVSICCYNCVGVEGLAGFENFAFSRGLAMPRPRNILIPAIMMAIEIGFQRIIICGADHSWSRTLSVDDDNRVVAVQPHFYKDNDKEHARVTQVYGNVKLHEVFQSYYIAFKSYHTIKRYADTKNIEIFNATPGSFIDAFPRKPLCDIN